MVFLRAAVLLFFAVTALHAASASAHAPPLSRDALVQVNADGSFVVWVSARLGRAERTAWLELQWDRNHDGALDAGERQDGAAGLVAPLLDTLLIENEGWRERCPVDHVARFLDHELWLHVLVSCDAGEWGAVTLIDPLAGRVSFAPATVGVWKAEQGGTATLPWLRRVDWVRQ